MSWRGLFQLQQLALSTLGGTFALTTILVTALPTHSVGQVPDAVLRPRCLDRVIQSSILWESCTYWEQTNGPQGAIVEALAIHPNGTVFAGTQRGGLYRSTDNGATWSYLDFGTAGYVSAIAFNAAGDVLAAVDRAVYRSTNNGTTWEETAPLVAGYYTPYVNALAVTAADVIYAGMDAGVVRSADNGQTWTPVTGLAGEVVAIAITSTGDLLVALHDGSHGQLYRSTDNGGTWSQLPLPTIWRIGSLSIGPNGELLVGTYLDGLYRSFDNGATWTPTSLTARYIYSLIETTGRILATDQDGIHRSSDGGTTWSRTLTVGGRELALAPSGDVFAAQGWNVYRSTDGGWNWNQTATQPVGTWLNALLFNSRGDLFAATDGAGVFKTSNAGDTWTRINSGLANGFVLSLAVNSQNYIFAGLDYNGGVFRSTNGGTNWYEKNNGLGWHYMINALAIDASDRVFAATDNGVYRSADNGDSWQRLTRTDNGFVGAASGGSDITILALAIKPGGLVFAGTYVGLYRSSDGGDHWSFLSPSAMCVGEDFVRVEKLIVAPDGALFAGTECGVVRSTNNGSNWSHLPAPLARAIGVSTNAIFVSTTRGWSGDVLHSSNGGSTWTERESGLKTTNVEAFAFDSRARVFAGSYGTGVYRKLIPKRPSSPFAEMAGKFSAQTFFDDFVFCIPIDIPGVPPSCPGEPGCPKCRAFGGFNSIPGERLEILRRMSQALVLALKDQTQGTRGRQDLARVARAARLGPNYSKARRDSVIAITRKKELTMENRRTVLGAINAFDLDSRLPKVATRRVDKGNRRIAFGSSAFTILPAVRSAGTLTFQISDAIPDSMPYGYRPVWPLGVYSLTFTGQLEGDEPAEIAFSLGGLGMKPGADARLLEWDGTRYRDITTQVDWEAGLVSGTMTRPSKYIIMEKVNVPLRPLK